MNYANFARPEASLEMTVAGYPCEECGQLCDETFCSAECAADAHTCDGDCDDFDPGPEMESDPGEYEPSEDDGDGYGDSGWQDDGRYDE